MHNKAEASYVAHSYTLHIATLEKLSAHIVYLGKQNIHNHRAATTVHSYLATYSYIVIC